MARLSQKIKGHDEVQARLMKALEKGSCPHALLFSGPSGVGKRKTAWAVTQSLLCEKSFSACGECAPCLRVEKGESESVLFIAPKTLQIKIDEVRAVTGFLTLQTSARAKIVILDEADRLNLQAVNFLLKIVEEPPPKSFFFFISPAPGKLPITLRSRLQNIRFKRLRREIVQALTSGEDWLISSAQGRMDVIEELKGKQNLRDISLNLWKRIFTSDHPPFALDFPAELKDREQALFVCRSWQWLLRDGRMMRAGEESGFIHGDQKDLRKQLAELPAGYLDFLIRQAIILEKNLRAYMDCVLCFERFALNFQKLSKNSGLI